MLCVREVSVCSSSGCSDEPAGTCRSSATTYPCPKCTWKTRRPDWNSWSRITVVGCTSASRGTSVLESGGDMAAGPMSGDMDIGVAPAEPLAEIRGFFSARSALASNDDLRESRCECPTDRLRAGARALSAFLCEAPSLSNVRGAMVVPVPAASSSKSIENWMSSASGGCEGPIRGEGPAGGARRARFVLRERSECGCVGAECARILAG
mmetsp:Transcript_17291/g.52272  ORF Transcript_17291/g.52272 Transcript_17291/m.52272 type:complete len:209 (+) Transcript_17291:1492-2118(+)